MAYLLKALIPLLADLAVNLHLLVKEQHLSATPVASMNPEFLNL